MSKQTYRSRKVTVTRVLARIQFGLGPRFTKGTCEWIWNGRVGTIMENLEWGINFKDMRIIKK